MVGLNKNETFMPTKIRHQPACRQAGKNKNHPSFPFVKGGKEGDLKRGIFK